jgi:hypothetical protein
MRFQMSEVSVRRVQVLQQQARVTLERFLGICSQFIENRVHFPSDFPATARSADSYKALQKQIAKNAGNPDPDNEASATMAIGRHYVDSFMRTLMLTANGLRPGPHDLDILTDALNKPFTVLLYFGDKANALGRRRYDHADKPEIRVAAELFLEYLNLTDDIGPAHTTCRICGRLMIKKRGGRKYCSKECSKSAWSYEKRKDKLRQNRQIHQQRTQKERAMRKAAKSTPKKGAK